MTKEEIAKEIAKQKELIIKELGMPEYDNMHDPVNESARKIKALQYLYLKQNQEIQKQKKLDKQIKQAVKLAATAVPVPEHLINPAWFDQFKEHEKKIVQKYLENTRQTAKQIADAVGSTVASVRAVKGLVAFKMLMRQIMLDWKEDQLFPSLAAVDDILASREEKTAAVRKDIAKTLLTDAGLLKQDSVNLEQNKQHLDPETLERLRQDSDKFIK